MDISGYKIIQPIENSGAGFVYLATQLSSGRAVVVKYLPKSLLDHAVLNRYLSRFDKEGETAKQVFHPNIAEVHEVGQNIEALYSVVDYIPGESLEKRASSMCLLDKIYVVKQLAGALDYLAQRKIGHYNIKPSNIILSSETSQAMLTDFGFAREMYQNAESLLQDKLLETADYASPEQQRRESLDARADLYSLGAVFCFLLTGKAPFKYGCEAVGSEQLGASFVQLPNELSVFQEFVDYALAKMPDERFQSGREMIDELEKIDDEIIIAIDGHSVESAKVSKKTPPVQSNVFSLSHAAKKKQRETFEKLLMPDTKTGATTPTRKSKNEWDDVPPTEFTNSYEYIESLKSGKHKGKKRAHEDKNIHETIAKITAPSQPVKNESQKKSGADKPLRAVEVANTNVKVKGDSGVDGIKNITPALSEKTKTASSVPRQTKPPATDKPLPHSELTNNKNKVVDNQEIPSKDASTLNKNPSVSPDSVTAGVEIERDDLLKENDFVDIPQEIYQTLAEQPCSSYDYAPKVTKKYLWRSVLLILLLLASAVIYFNYSREEKPKELGVQQIQGNEQVGLSFDYFIFKTRDRLEMLQNKLREGIYDIVSGKTNSSVVKDNTESSLSFVPIKTKSPLTLMTIDQHDSQITDEVLDLVIVQEQRRTQKQERIDWLLGQAQTLKKEGKLLYPADHNAVLIYKEVLALNPENFIAITEMQSIRKEIIEQINLMLELGHFDAADALLTRINIFFKPAPPTGDLALRIREQRQSR
ncbi:MAG: serine/threonine protein kinase [Pseudomonadales bacterium]|nr:serine/threonine protein kinase [Pseudomonadales bacterium]MCP5215559.1 serine/threonine protein kinase [Pseudomonadales bacterium]